MESRSLYGAGAVAGRRVGRVGKAWARPCLLGLLLLAAVAGSAVAEDATNATVITSEQLDFDYKRMIAIFERDVVVVDPQMRIECDKLIVLFENDNEIKSVTSLGNVSLWHGDKKGRCDRAVYLAKTGEVLLTGNASVRRGDDTLSGNKITFWTYEDRIECEGGTLIIVPGEEDGVGLGEGGLFGPSGGDGAGPSGEGTPAPKSE